MPFIDSQFRELAECIAETIRELDGIAGRRDVTVIVEDKGSVENVVANALSVAGIAVIVGVTGYTRGNQTGPLIIGRVALELRVLERPSVNRTVQGFITTQEMAEKLVRALHWRPFGNLGGRPLLFQDFQREDNDQFNIARLTFQGECSLGMITPTPNQQE